MCAPLPPSWTPAPTPPNTGGWWKALHTLYIMGPIARSGPHFYLPQARLMVRNPNIHQIYNTHICCSNFTMSANSKQFVRMCVHCASNSPRFP